MTSAARSSAAAVPVAAALLGGALLGPVGLLVGLKGAGIAAAALGAGAGYFSGILPGVHF